MRADTIKEKNYKPFADVKAELAKTWIADQRNVGNKIKVEKAINELVQGKTNLKNIANDNGVDIKTTTLIRSKDPTAPLTKPAQKLLFEIPKGHYGYGAVKDGYIIGQVTDVNLPDVSKLSDDKLKDTIQTAQGNEQNEYFDMYLNKLYADYKVKVNAELLRKTYGSDNGQVE